MPIVNAFNPFTVADATVTLNGVPVPVTTGVRFRSVNDTGVRNEKFTYWDYLFDVGLKGEMGDLVIISRRGTGKPVSVTFATKGRTCPWVRSASLVCEMRCWIRIRRQPLIPSWAFGRNSNTAINRVYVNLHNSATWEHQLFTPRLTAIYLNCLRGQCRLRSAANMTC